MQIVAKLDKEARDALPEEHFAVPGKRKLPINDERHTRLAWDMVDRTQGLSPEERAEARRRILHRAHEIGINTDDWHKMAAMAIEAMALNISNDDGHPNKMPFSGVLTRVGLPSDAPPGGSGGRRVVVTKEAAEAAIGSLLGMAIDFTPDYDGHDTQAKIGIITSAVVNGNAVEIEGFVYASDFPAEAAHIRAHKSALGFSFEAQRIRVADPSADPLVITECVFTGAAILRKDKAAYRTTSLAAAADDKDFHDMTPDELKAMLDAALAPLVERLDKVEASAAHPNNIAASVRDVVEPHAQACEAAADGMEAAGIGTHPTMGHVSALRRIAGSLRAAAAMGALPTIHRDHDWPLSAGKDGEGVADDVKKAVEAATKDLSEKLAAAETKIADVKAAAFAKSEAPERKTISPAIQKLLAKAGADAPEDGQFTVSQVEALIAKANISDPVERLALKRAAGL